MKRLPRRIAFPELALLTAVLMGVCAAAPACAWTLYVPAHPGGQGRGATTMPPWFSGTNANASGEADPDPGDPAMLSYTLSINGATVSHMTYDGTEGAVQTWSDCAFDSSHFADGSTITVTFSITVQGSNTPITQTGTAPAYNKAYVLGNNTDPKSIWSSTATGAVSPDAQSMNEGNPPPTSTTDSKTTILSNIPTYTVFYMGTHGTSSTFGDCNATGTTGNYLSDTDISTAVAKKTTSQPPYNFVQLDACLCGSVNDLDYSFGIPGNNPDQAFFGWVPVISIDTPLKTYTAALWSSLLAGNTLSVARGAANRAGSPGWYDTTTTPWTYYSSGAVSAILGDSAATIHGTAYGAPQGNWFKVLDQ